MSGERKCPKCGDDVSLVDPNEDVWGLAPEDYDDAAEVWLCVACDWNEEADADEALAEHSANLEWIMERIGQTHVSATPYDQEAASRPIRARALVAQSRANWDTLSDVWDELSDPEQRWLITLAQMYVGTAALSG